MRWFFQGVENKKGTVEAAPFFFLLTFWEVFVWCRGEDLNLHGLSPTNT
jgi:hypothetical protein